MIDKLKSKVWRELEIKPKDPSRAAAVTALFAPIKNPGILFIERRVAPDDPWSGQIALPGGRFKAEDGNLLRTALREMYEEVGIALPRESYLGHVGYFSPRNRPEIKVIAYIAFLEKRPEVRIGEEVREAFWADLKSLTESWEVAELELAPGRLWRGRIYRVKGRVIWGMTARIVSKILSLL